jgi:hypothetical protein
LEGSNTGSSAAKRTVKSLWKSAEGSTEGKAERDSWWEWVFQLSGRINEKPLCVCLRVKKLYTWIYFQFLFYVVFIDVQLHLYIHQMFHKETTVFTISSNMTAICLQPCFLRGIWLIVYLNSLTYYDKA